MIRKLLKALLAALVILAMTAGVLYAFGARIEVDGGGTDADVEAAARPAAPARHTWYGASMVKVTFTLDDATVEKLRATASRLKKPQSQVVREAVAAYEPRADRLTEAERQRLIAAFDRLHPQAATRTQQEANREIAAIRRARRSGGRRTPVR